jgi:hypothetical protein
MQAAVLKRCKAATDINLLITTASRRREWTSGCERGHPVRLCLSYVKESDGWGYRIH